MKNRIVLKEAWWVRLWKWLTFPYHWITNPFYRMKWKPEIARMNKSKDTAQQDIGIQPMYKSTGSLPIFLCNVGVVNPIQPGNEEISQKTLDNL